MATSSSDQVEAHAAALYVALLNAGQLARARAFMRWWTAGRPAGRIAPAYDEWLAEGAEDWNVGPDEYDADELGLDPENEDPENA